MPISDEQYSSHSSAGPTGSLYKVGGRSQGSPPRSSVERALHSLG